MKRAMIICAIAIFCFMAQGQASADDRYILKTKYPYCEHISDLQMIASAMDNGDFKAMDRMLSKGDCRLVEGFADGAVVYIIGVYGSVSKVRFGSSDVPRYVETKALLPWTP